MTRVEMATRDLEEARQADLASMDPAVLVLMVERLRGSLDDVLRLVSELNR